MSKIRCVNKQGLIRSLTLCLSLELRVPGPRGADEEEELGSRAGLYTFASQR
jgi:hypothetical protein